MENTTALNENTATNQSLTQMRFPFARDYGDARNKNIEAKMRLLPESHEPYTDKYFLRSNEILKAEGLNPIVRAQVFIRKGDAELAGIDEAIAIIRKYSNLEQNGGSIKALEEGSIIKSKENILELEGHIQDIIELETMYLGVIARETTLVNGGIRPVAELVTARAGEVVEAADGRPVQYFGARHWGYEQDAEIAKAAFDGGFIAASTDIAAEQISKFGQGTIPHALENVMAKLYGPENAVVEATKAFDRNIDPAVPRIALIDYNNKEIDDSIATAKALDGALSAVRVDTCGENIAQGAIPSPEVFDYLVSRIKSGQAMEPNKLSEFIEGSFGKRSEERASETGNWLATATRVALSDVEIKPEHLKYWTGTGVTISGVYELRKALDEAGFSNVEIILTSGFGNPLKDEAFRAAEDILGVKLFDQVGAGQLYESRAATMDIVNVADSYEELNDNPVSKVGRYHRPNPYLETLKPLNSNTIN